MNTSIQDTLPPLSHKDRSIVYIGLIAIALLSWLYLLTAAGQHSRMDMAAMTMPHGAAGGRGLHDFLILFLMWAVMMSAMMLPSIVPAALVFTAFNQRIRAQHKPYVRTYVFVAGYLAAWVFCALLYTLAQSALSRSGMLDAAMKADSLLLSGGIVLLAALYQWTPLKVACLKHCRTPLGFFLGRWRAGHSAAISMGLHYGLYCVGCCWALMAIMFAVGTMNILWMAILSAFVLCEKLLPANRLVRNSAAIALLVWGGYLLLRGLS